MASCLLLTFSNKLGNLTLRCWPHHWSMDMASHQVLKHTPVLVKKDYTDTSNFKLYTINIIFHLHKYKTSSVKFVWLLSCSDRCPYVELIVEGELIMRSERRERCAGQTDIKALALARCRANPRTALKTREFGCRPTLLFPYLPRDSDRGPYMYIYVLYKCLTRQLWSMWKALRNK